MKKYCNLIVSALLGAAALPAAAVSVWNYGAAYSGGSVAAPFSVNSSGGAPSATVTSSISGITGGQTSASVISAATMYWYGQSLGIGTEAAPYHAVDNQGAYEFLLLTFSSKVSLSAITVGYNGIDNASPNTSRASVLAFTGSPPVNAVPNITNGNDTWGNLTAAYSSANNTGGWQSIGTYDVGTPANNTAAVSTTVYSSYWLVGAYNPLFTNAGATAPSPGDLFKFVSVSGCAASDTTSSGCTTPPPSGGRVPEPGSLALFGLAFAGIGALRRRKA